jgi:hypothetical protein
VLNQAALKAAIDTSGHSAVTGLRHFAADMASPQVFVISWRNPDARHATWDFNTYGQVVLEAMDAIARITGASRPRSPGSAPAASSPPWWPRTWRTPAARTGSPHSTAEGNRS